jgi:anti-sigma regulatory factor (Ser/Thr protein kinase)
MRELALHILDVTRNAIEAGATAIELTVVEDRQGNRLEFTIQDNGPGMAPEHVAQAADPFYTTRTTRRVGLGLALLSAACERSGGELQISSRPGAGTTVRGCLQLAHIDRPPLGDMGKVIQALACEADHTSFRYRHRTDRRVFEIDTGELQRELGDVPVTDPRVLCWLGEFVKNGIVNVGSRA